MNVFAAERDRLVNVSLVDQCSQNIVPVACVGILCSLCQQRTTQSRRHRQQESQEDGECHVGMMNGVRKGEIARMALGDTPLYTTEGLRIGNEPELVLPPFNGLRARNRPHECLVTVLFGAAQSSPKGIAEHCGVHIRSHKASSICLHSGFLTGAFLLGEYWRMADDSCATTRRECAGQR